MDIFFACHPHPFTTEAIGSNSDLMQCIFQPGIQENIGKSKIQYSLRCFDRWKGYLTDFSFGTKMGTDFVNELARLYTCQNLFR
jgi:hypothetical protein